MAAKSSGGPSQGSTLRSVESALIMHTVQSQGTSSRAAPFQTQAQDKTHPEHAPRGMEFIKALTNARSHAKPSNTTPSPLSKSPTRSAGGALVNDAVAANYLTGSSDTSDEQVALYTTHVEAASPRAITGSPKRDPAPVTQASGLKRLFHALRSKS